MNEPARILFCHCAHAEVVPAEVKSAVLRTLGASGVAFEMVADLCELSARRDPWLQRFADGGPVKIAACFPRAVKWLFAAGRAPLPPGAAQILNMREQSAAQIVSAQLGPEFSPASPGLEATPVPPAAPPAWLPWFPVIDFDRCTHCMQCLSFCLFDVFGVSADQKIEVRHPANCKTNCPACSRVCPEAAIVFPKYKSAPINGAEVSAADGLREAVKVDISALLGGDLYSRLRERNARGNTRFSKERDPDQALAERRQCLAKLAQLGDIPPEVLMALPSVEEIQRRAQEAAAKARAALEQKG